MLWQQAILVREELQAACGPLGPQRQTTAQWGRDMQEVVGVTDRWTICNYSRSPVSHRFPESSSLRIFVLWNTDEQTSLSYCSCEDLPLSHSPSPCQNTDLNSTAKTAFCINSRPFPNSTPHLLEFCTGLQLIPKPGLDPYLLYLKADEKPG